MAISDRTVFVKIAPKDGGVIKYIDAIGESLKQLKKQFQSPNTSSNFVGFDLESYKKQFAKLKELSTEQRSFSRILFKGEVADAVNASKSKLSAAQTANKQLLSDANNTFRALEAAKRREYSEFVRLEKEKAKAAKAPTGNSNLQTSFLGSFGGNLAADAVSGLTSILTSGGSAVLDYSAKLEQARIGFTTLTGSAQAAQKHITDLQNFAKATPFEFAGLLKSSQLLQGVGINSERIIPILSDVGNALSAVGKGQEEIERTVLALSQIASKGKVAGQEINQLAENGISAVTILAQATGKSRAEIIKLSEAGQISSDFFLESLNAFIKQNKLGDSMKAQSQTFSGALSNIKDTLYIASSTYFAPLFKTISEISVRTAKQMEGADFSEATKILAKNIAQGFGEALGTELANEANSYNWSKFASDLNTPSNIGASIADGLLGDFNFADYISKKLGGGTSKEIDLSKQNFFVKNGGFIGSLFIDESKGVEKLKASVSGTVGTVRQIKKAIDETGNLSTKLGAPSAEAQVKSLKTALDSALGLSDISNKIKQAQINSGLDLTDDAKLKTFKASTAQTANELKTRIALQSAFFDKELSLYKTDALKTADITEEKNKTLGVLNGELKVNEINSQKEIREREYQILEQRRQSLIDFKNLQIKQSQFDFDNRSFGIARAIEQDSSSAGAAFAELRRITQENYQKISALTIETYQEQLKNQALTKEQRLNLTTELYQSEQDLAEKNRRAIIQIEDNQYQEQLQAIDRFSQSRQDSFQSSINLFSESSNLFSPQNFGGKTVAKSLGDAFFGGDFDKMMFDAETDVQQYQNIVLAYQNVLTGDLKPAERSSITADSNSANKALGQVEERLKILTSAYPKAQVEVFHFSKALSDGTANVHDFDNAQRKLLESTQLLENAKLGSAIGSLQDKAQLAYAKGDIDGAKEFGKQIQALSNDKILLGLKQASESQNLYNDSLKGLQEQFDKLKNYDPATILALQAVGMKNLASEKNNLAAENILLEQKYYADAELLSEQYKNKRLNDEKEVFFARKQLGEKGIFSQSDSDLKVLDYLNSQIKSTSETFADFRIGLGQTFFDAIDSPFDALSKKLEKMNPIVRGLAQTFLNLGRDILRAFSQKLIMKLLGLDGASSGGQTNASGGGIFSGLGGIIKNLFGGRGAAAAGGGGLPANGVGTAFGGNAGGGIFNFAGGGRSLTADNLTNIGNVTNGRGDTFVSGKAGRFGGIGGALQALAPALGIGLGSQIGGGRGAGGILGSIGGGLLGTVGAAFGSSSTALGGAFGSIGGLLNISGSATLGIGAAIGGGVLLASYLIGRNSKRRKEEKQRTEFINTALTDLKDFDKLIADTKALKIQPPSSAITTGEALAKSVREQYLTAANGLKDKKTRNIALRDVSRVDSSISDKMSQLRAAVAGATNATEFSNKFVATFAGGAYTTSPFMKQFAGFKQRYGLLQGGTPGKDSIPVLAMENEMFLKREHQTDIIRGAGYDVFAAHTSIPNYPAPRKMAGGGFIGTGGANVSTASPNFVFGGSIVFENCPPPPSDAKVFYQSPDGKRQVINIVRESINQNDSSSDGIVRDIKKQQR